MKQIQKRPTLFAKIYLWATYRLYNEFAWLYDIVSWLVSFGKWSHWRSQVLMYIKGDKILELGFGTGELLKELKERDYQVVGLDPSESMHRVAGKKFIKQCIQVPLVQGIIQNCPFESNTFDTVISTFPAGFIYDPDTFSELARVLIDPQSIQESEPSRFIVCGVYLESESIINHSLYQFCFGKSDTTSLDRYSQLADANHFNLWIQYPSKFSYDIPILIFERRP